MNIDIYTDGSFNPVADCYGGGAVILQDGIVVEELVIPSPSSLFNKFRNVAGEVLAATYALLWAQDHCPDAHITLHYDYAGIECWCTGKWRANNGMSRSYADFTRALTMDLKFKQVRGHSGDEFNDRADTLARKAAGLS